MQANLFFAGFTMLCFGAMALIAIVYSKGPRDELVFSMGSAFMVGFLFHYIMKIHFG